MLMKVYSPKTKTQTHAHTRTKAIRSEMGQIHGGAAVFSGPAVLLEFNALHFAPFEYVPHSGVLLTVSGCLVVGLPRALRVGRVLWGMRTAVPRVPRRSHEAETRWQVSSARASSPQFPTGFIWPGIIEAPPVNTHQNVAIAIRCSNETNIFGTKIKIWVKHKGCCYSPP